MIIIDVPDKNDSFSSVVLDGTEYLLRFTYNFLFDYWSFGLYDVNENSIIAMIKIVPNYPLLYPYQSNNNLPPGIFGALSSLEKIGRNDFKNGNATFAYIGNSELS